MDEEEFGDWNQDINPDLSNDQNVNLAEEYDLDDFSNDDDDEKDDYYNNHFTQVSRTTNQHHNLTDHTLPDNDTPNVQTRQHKTSLPSDGASAVARIQSDVVVNGEKLSQNDVQRLLKELSELKINNHSIVTRKDEKGATNRDAISPEAISPDGADSDKKKRETRCEIDWYDVDDENMLLCEDEQSVGLITDNRDASMLNGDNWRQSGKHTQSSADVKLYDISPERAEERISAIRREQRKDKSTVKKVRFLHSGSCLELEEGEVECFEINKDAQDESDDDDDDDENDSSGEVATGGRIGMNIKNDIVVDSKKTANTDAFKKDETSLTTVKKYSTPSIEDRISKFNDVRVTKGKDDSENKLKHVQKLPLLTIKNGKGVQDTSDNNLWDIVERSPTVKNNASVNVDSTSNGTEVIEKDEQNLDNAEQRMLEAAAKADIQYMESSLSSDSTLYNIHDDRGNTILHIVCKFGHMDCLQWLVKNTLCRELVLLDNDDVQTPAIVAVKHGKLECLQWLVLETGVKKQLTNEVNQPVLLHQAARFGQEQCLRWLLGYMQMQDLSIDVTDPHGNTAAHLAAKYGHLSCLQTLVEFNADITATNKKGHTACKVAANHHHDTSAQFLIVVESCITLAEQVTGFRKELREVRQENIVLRSRLDDLKGEYIDLTGKLIKQLDDLYQKKTSHRSRSSSSSSLEETLGAEIAASKDQAEALRRRCEELMEQENKLKEKEEKAKKAYEVTKKKLELAGNEYSQHTSKVDENFPLEPLDVMRGRLREVSHRIMMYRNAKTVHEREVLAASYDSLSSRSSLSSPTSVSPAVSPRTSISSQNSPPGTLPRFATHNALFSSQPAVWINKRHSDGHNAVRYFTEPGKSPRNNDSGILNVTDLRLGKKKAMHSSTGDLPSHPLVNIHSRYSSGNSPTTASHKDIEFDIPCIEVFESRKCQVHGNLSQEVNPDSDSNLPILTPVDSDSVFEEYNIDGMFPGNHLDRHSETDISGKTMQKKLQELSEIRKNESMISETGHCYSAGSEHNAQNSASPVLRSGSSTSSVESLDSGSKKSRQRGSSGSNHSEGLYEGVGSNGRPIPESIPQWILTSNKPRRPEPIIEKIGSSTENLKRIFAKHIPAQQLDVIRRMDECMRKVQPSNKRDAVSGEISVRIGKDAVHLPENLAPQHNEQLVDEDAVEKDGKGHVKLTRRNNKDRRIKFAGFKGAGARNSSDESMIKEILEPIYETPPPNRDAHNAVDCDAETDQHPMKVPRKAERVLGIGVTGDKKKDKSGRTMKVTKKDKTSTVKKNMESKHQSSAAVDVQHAARAAHPRIPDHCMDLSQDIDDRSVNKNSEQLNTKKRSGKLLSQSAEDPLMTETSRGSQDLGTLDDNETRQRRSGVEIDASNVTSNGVERLPFNLSDVPSDEFNSFTLSGLDEEDTGKAWYENSDEEDSMEPTPRPVVRKTANTNRGKSTSKDKTNKHIYFL